MRDYELTMIIDSGIAEKDQQAVLGKIKKLLEAGKVKILKEEIWGVKKLAYPIAKKEAGLYLFYIIQSQPQPLAEFEKKLKLEEKVLRYLIIKQEGGTVTQAK